MTNLPLPSLGPASASSDVSAFGENSLDFVCRRGTAAAGSKQSLDDFQIFVGGQMATAAVGVARLGWRSRYVGAFGDDELTARVTEHVRGAGVDVVAVVRSGLRSRVAVIFVDAEGERQVFEYRDPRLEISVPDLPLAQILDCRIVLLDGTHPQASLALSAAAREAGRPTIVDVDRVSSATLALLAEVDVVVVPESFALEATGASRVEVGLTDLARRCPHSSLVVVTRGERGSLALGAGQLVDVPGFHVPVEDTTGAGDAFRAGLAAGWLQAGDLGNIGGLLRYANAVAALNCRKAGAMTGLPTHVDVQTLLNEMAI